LIKNAQMIASEYL